MAEEQEQSELEPKAIDPNLKRKTLQSYAA